MKKFAVWIVNYEGLASIEKVDAMSFGVEDGLIVFKDTDYNNIAAFAGVIKVIVVDE